MGRIIIPYKPRGAFLPYHNNTKRLATTVAHRRAGKTVARINRLIKAASICELPNPRFGYLAPFYVQAKDIAWLYLKHYTSPFVEYGLKVNESELSVTLPHNSAIIKLYGAENAERMRGLYFDGIVPDEAQGVPKKVLTSIILPCLADRQGWLDVSGTPKGWDNLLGELVRMARENPDEWFLQILKASETGILPKEELDRLKRLMPENEYAQEFECDFDAAITGAVYGKWMSDAETEGRFKVGIYDPTLKVYTAWDLGFDDATAIWFYQVAGREIRLIHYYENNGQDITHYCDYLKHLDYNYADHYVPHDAANKLLAAGGRSIVQQAFAQGVSMRVVSATSQQNQIEAARMVLKQCWFDPVACKDGVGALKQYQFEFDEDKQTYRSKPRHDWASHGSDAFEIIGQVMKEQTKEVEPPKPRFFTDLTAKEIFWPENSDTGVKRI